MSNEYFNATGVPAAGSQVQSRPLRTQFDKVQEGFELLPVLAGENNKLVIVNAAGTALTTMAGLLTLGGTLTTSGAYGITFALGGTAAALTLPTTGTLATKTGTETWTNKTFTAATIVSAVFSGTATGSLTGGTISSVTLSGTPTITSPTLGRTIFSGTASGSWTSLTLASFASYDTSLVVASPTMTSPSIVSGGGMTLTSGQIVFPATQAASADATTLDDYEEGTWTPTCSPAGSATYTSRVALYTKIGRHVTVTCEMTINAIGTGGTSKLTGLPFTVSSAFACAPCYWGAAASAFRTLFVTVQSGSGDITFRGAAGSTITSTNAVSPLKSGTTIKFTLTYDTAT